MKRHRYQTSGETEKAFIKRYGQKVWDAQNQNSKHQDGGVHRYKNGGYVPQFQTGGEKEPEVIFDPEEFKRREQAYTDSLTLHNYANEFFNNGIYNVNIDREAELYEKYDVLARVDRLKKLNKENPTLAKRHVYPEGAVRGFYYKKPTTEVILGRKAKATGNYNNPDVRSEYDLIKSWGGLPEKSKRGSTAKTTQGVQGMPYQKGGYVPQFQTRGTAEGRARDRFKSYLMEQEAGRDYISRKRSDTPKPGGGYYKQYEGDRYYPYKMPSEEHYTVGYGHYGPDAKGYTEGIDEEQARNFLEKDMDNAVRLAGIYVDENKKSPYSSNPNKSFKDLDSHTKYMLADYPYNLGKLSKFPKFTEAVLTGDTTTAREQYLRYDKNNRPIVKRNEAFSETFLEPWVERQRNSNQVKLPYKPYPLRVPPRGAGGT